MGNHYHAIVWIDHQQAKVFHFDSNDADLTTVRSTHPHQHIHHKANARDSGHAPVDATFLKHVAEALSGAGAILIAGPASAKTELAAYIEREQPRRNSAHGECGVGREQHRSLKHLRKRYANSGRRMLQGQFPQVFADSLQRTDSYFERVGHSQIGFLPGGIQKRDHDANSLGS